MLPRVCVCLVMSAESLEPIGGGGDDSIRREGENGSERDALASRI